MHNKTPKRKRKIPKRRASTGLNKFSLAYGLKDMIIIYRANAVEPVGARESFHRIYPGTKIRNGHLESFIPRQSRIEQLRKLQPGREVQRVSERDASEANPANATQRQFSRVFRFRVSHAKIGSSPTSPPALY